MNIDPERLKKFLLFLFSFVIAALFLSLIFGGVKRNGTNIALFFIILLLFMFVFGGLFDAPWIPTRKKDFKRIANLVNIRQEQVFYDIGSGTGKLLFYLSREYDIQCIGIEISPLFYLYSKVKSLFNNNINILYGDFHNYDLSGADIIYAFLMPRSIEKLKRKLAQELKKDTKIVISYWPFHNCSPINVSKVNNGMIYYLYDKSSILPK